LETKATIRNYDFEKGYETQRRGVVLSNA